MNDGRYLNMASAGVMGVLGGTVFLVCLAKPDGLDIYRPPAETDRPPHSPGPLSFLHPWYGRADPMSTPSPKRKRSDPGITSSSAPPRGLPPPPPTTTTTTTASTPKRPKTEPRDESPRTRVAQQLGELRLQRPEAAMAGWRRSGSVDDGDGADGRTTEMQTRDEAGRVPTMDRPRPGDGPAPAASASPTTGKPARPAAFPPPPSPPSAPGPADEDEDDDGGAAATGLDGIGYRPTAAQAWARAERRKLQVAEYKSREAREARRLRSLKRALGGEGRGEGKTAELGDTAGEQGRRRVKFEGKQKMWRHIPPIVPALVLLFILSTLSLLDAARAEATHKAWACEAGAFSYTCAEHWAGFWGKFHVHAHNDTPPAAAPTLLRGKWACDDDLVREAVYARCSAQFIHEWRCDAPAPGLTVSTFYMPLAYGPRRCVRAAVRAGSRGECADCFAMGRRGEQAQKHRQENAAAGILAAQQRKEAAAEEARQEEQRERDREAAAREEAEARKGEARKGEASEKVERHALFRGRGEESAAGAYASIGVTEGRGDDEGAG
ncbi:MAG: hypothetical protein M1832_002515 [Thelocarpon impressellum]|nr:MAG: hypothetical protein M1832_002515 [Thelocarpon impressellum]